MELARFVELKAETTDGTKVHEGKSRASSGSESACNALL